MAEFRITKASGYWVVRIAGSVIGETRNALVLDEDGFAPVIYFPRDALAMALFEPSDTSTTCPDKGEASYFGFTSPDVSLADVAWSYEAPIDKAARIAGHVAFDAERVTVEQL